MGTRTLLRVLVIATVAACASEGTKPATNQATRLAFVNQPATIASGSTINAIQVAAQDANGNVVTQSTTPVVLAITTGTGASGATLTGTLTRTPVDGVATFDGLAIGKTGAAYTLTAAAAGLSSATSAAFDVTVGAPTKLAILSQPTATTAGAAMTPGVQVLVQDAFGNTATGASTMIDVAITNGTGSSGAVLGGTVSQAAASGTALFGSLTIDKAATGYTLTVSASGLSGAITNAFTVSPGAPATLAIIAQPTNVSVGSGINPAVQVSVRDAFGNTVTSAAMSIAIAITSGTGTSGAILGGTNSRTPANGVATFNDLTIDRAGTGYALTISGAGLSSATTNTFSVTAAAASKLAITVQPSGVSAGASIAPSVQVAVQDAAGNTITTATNSVTIAITSGTGAGGAVLSGTKTRAAVAGIATFDNLSINKSGTGYTFDATASGLTLARSNSFNVTPGSALKLAFTVQPSAAAQGATISPAVQVTVRDANDNTVTSATNSVTLAITSGTGTGGAILGGTLSRAAVSGIATFNNLTVDLAGTGYTLSATSASLTTATSATFDVTATVASGCGSSQPGRIFCDDFETDRLADYFEVTTDGSSFARINGVGRNGSYGMRSRFAAGQVSAGSLKLAFGRTPDAYIDPVDAGTRDYREIYWRFYVRNQAGWTGGGGDKLTRLTIFAASNWAQAMIAHVWSGMGADRDYLMLDPASGTDAAGVLKTTQYNDFANLRWLGAARSATPIFSTSNVGQWYCIETRVKLNTAGLSDGVFELRINGQLEASRTALNWVGNFSAYGLNAILLESYWNDGSPAAQERYFDDFVVSEQPIGC